MLIVIVAIAGCAAPARLAPTATSAAPLLEAPALSLVTAAPATTARVTTMPATAAAASAPAATAAPSAAPIEEQVGAPTQAPAQASAPGPTQAPSATRRAPRATATPDDGLRTIALADLPRQARDTVRLIRAGGPFPFERDGVTFQNREQLLPRRPRGYYREYTVITPGSGDRGARRIVAGEGGELYYTDDHYDSFRRVIP